MRRIPAYLPLLCGAFALAGVLAVSFPETPGTQVASIVSTVVIAVPALAALFLRLGVRRALVSLAGVSLFAFAIETTGVVTGLPYGEFSYGEELGPKVGGLVPYVLPVSYVPLVIGAVAAAEPRGRNRPLWVLGAAALLVAIDGVLDPGAVRMGLWDWPAGGAYYGVPLSNYLGWCLTSVPAALLLLVLGRWWRGTAPRPMLLDSTIVALAFWTAVCAASGLLVPALLGAGLFVFFVWRRLALSELRQKRWRQ